MSVNTVVVGYGRSFHSRLFHCNVIRATEGLTLYGVCARNPQYKEEAEREYHCEFFTNLVEVLEDDNVELVVIATPSYLHAEMALRALSAGKHVVVEKPMCLRLSEADALIEASQCQGRLLTVYHNRRWDDDFLTIQQALLEEKLGPLILITVASTDRVKPSGWRTRRVQGGGVVHDIGVHLIDQALQLIGSDPVTVYAVVGNWGWDIEAETYARLWVGFRSGVSLDVELSHISWMPRPRWVLLGEKGNLSYEGGKIRLRSDEGESELAPVVGDSGGFYRNVSDVLNRSAEPAVTPQQIRTVINITQAAFLSSETGKVVELHEISTHLRRQQ